jgi:hypothetical protein
MTHPISRRSFAGMTAGFFISSASAADDKPAPPSGPTEAPYERDYPMPGFKPSWKRQ